MRELLLKIKAKIKSDPEACAKFYNCSKGYCSVPEYPSFLQWANNAGNHLFDDHPEWFGITKQEGSEVRAYFQSSPDIKELKEWGVIE